MDAAGRAARRADSTVLSPMARSVIGATAAGAGVVHLAMVPAHFQESAAIGLGFGIAGWFQLAFAAAVLHGPTRRVMQVGLLGSVVITAAWALSRTAGLPLPGAAGEVEAVGTVDLVCVGMQVLTAAFCLAALLRPSSASPPRHRLTHLAAAVPIIAVVLVTTATLASPDSADHHAAAAAGGHEAMADDLHVTDDASASDHHAAAAAGGHEAMADDLHTTTTDDAAGADVPHATGDEIGAPVPYDPTLPIDLSGTPGVTPQQQAEAELLISATLADLPQWEDAAVAEAAGFRSIGDGFTGVEHLINQEFIEDDIILDPHRPESLVYSTEGGGRRLVAAMYMATPGTTLETVPELGGALIQWHIHNNLCYTPDGLVRGLTDGEGNCAAGLVKPREIPMVHVWIQPHPCGPFAALEGIGGGQVAEGEEQLCDEAHGADHSAAEDAEEPTETTVEGSDHPHDPGVDPDHHE